LGNPVLLWHGGVSFFRTDWVWRTDFLFLISFLPPEGFSLTHGFSYSLLLPFLPSEGFFIGARIFSDFHGFFQICVSPDS
jgi:hypothetical protein